MVKPRASSPPPFLAVHNTPLLIFRSSLHRCNPQLANLFRDISNPSLSAWVIADNVVNTLHSCTAGCCGCTLAARNVATRMRMSTSKIFCCDDDKPWRPRPSHARVRVHVCQLTSSGAASDIGSTKCRHNGHRGYSLSLVRDQGANLCARAKP